VAYRDEERALVEWSMRGARVWAVVCAVSTAFFAASARAQAPLPSVAAVVEKAKVGDPLETALRQSAALNQLVCWSVHALPAASSAIKRRPRRMLR
jgi:hypothetical protein